MSALRERLDRDSIPEPNTGCLLWFGVACRLGYGRVGWEGKNWLAHRLSYTEAKGPIPAGLHLLHKCDTPACINPDHLRPGTPADNVADMMAKGRENRDPRPYQQGTKNQNSKITDDVVRGILTSPLDQKRAAKAFGVAASWVQRIRKREVWQHVEVPDDQIPPRRFWLKRKTIERREAA